LGGAVGDALGASVEFLSLAQIRARFGPQGLTDLAPAYGLLGAVTDDTQLTLFTAEGLIRANNRYLDRAICDTPVVVYGAYLRWLDTQGGRSQNPAFAQAQDGWLVGVPELRARRSPGNTCLTALQGPKMGSLSSPINDSKGCGGVMRIAPVGLLGWPAKASFLLGCELAAITHGHPSGYLAAGCLAATIAEVVSGQTLPAAIATATAILKEQPHHRECLTAVEDALEQARGKARPGPEAVERLGAGWLAEEALAIALYCAAVADSFEEGVLLAANHSGDTDSTAAITGNLLGALLGREAIPAKWLDKLELRGVIDELAGDMFRHFGGGEFQGSDEEKYPPH
jgi:ADP-ribosylglycohydrolase